MYQIPTGAIARLVMVSGSIVSEAEVAQILESYNYQQDSNDPNRWVLMDAGMVDGNAALVFSNEGEIIDVYSESDENILNLNYIAMRIGWADCEIYTINQDVEDKLLVRLVNVGIANQSSPNGVVEPEPTPRAATPASAPASPIELAETVPAKPPAAPTSTPAEASAIDSMNEDYQQLQQLRVKLAEAEQRNEELAEDKGRLEARVRQLESICAAPTAAPARVSEERHDDDSGLVRIVEKHLLSLLDLSAVNQSGLMAELKEHGYRVDVKLARS